MSAPLNALFRKEAIEHRADRLHGDVSIALPMPWQVISYMLLAALAVAVLFLFLASYSRVETVAGAIVLDRGVAAIVPTRPGIVVSIEAREGERVRAGNPLAQVRAEEDMRGGEVAAERVIEALEQQDARLASQSSLVMDAAAADRSRVAAQIGGITQQIENLDQQIRSQERLIVLAESDYRASQSVARRGFVSQRDLEVRESALLARRQQLSELAQSRASLTSALVEARRAIAQTGATAQAQAAGVASSRAQVAQRRADVEAARGYTLTSPIDGTVTAVTARPGQTVTQQQSLMVVVPADATPRAELYVPTSAAGFLAVGQNVRLAVDAFPYQRYGSVEATIRQISSVAIPRAGADGTAIPVYLVTAELRHPWVLAFGRRQPLLPGMTLSARIVTERQSLFEWLFQPVLAVRRR